MTFNWVKIILAALWVRFILDGTYSIDEFAMPNYIAVETLNPTSGFYYLLLPLWYLGMFFGQFGQVISDFIPEGLSTVAEEERSIFPYLPFFLSCAVLAIGINQKYNTKLKHDRKISFDPMSGGKSIFFEEILNKFQIKNRERALFWIEFGLLLFIAATFYIYRSSTPELVNYAAFFAAGAVGLLIDYQIDILKTRKEIEYRMANEYRAINIQKAYEEYRSSGGFVDRMATVSYAGYAQPPYYQSFASLTGKSGPSLFNSTNATVEKIGIALREYGKFTPLLLIPLFLWIVIMPSKAITEVGVVSTENLTLRKKPKRASGSVMTLSEGSVLQITRCGIIDGDGREWCHIVAGEVEGYAVKKGSSGAQYMWTEPIDYHLIDIGILPISDYVKTLTGSTLNLRSEPSLAGNIIDAIPDGAEVRVLNQVGSPLFLEVDSEQIFGVWLEIDFLGQKGYCFSWYLENCRIPSTFFGLSNNEK
ncbi:MAG: SH3 domain-containing protein [Chlamydiota bacterium]